MKLEVAVADVSQSVKALTIEIAADEVKAEFDKIYDGFQRQAKIPGFRPGRVPRGVVKQRFGKEIKDEVAKQLLPHALEHAIKDANLRIISEPAIQELSIIEGEPMKFKAHVEVLPEFELKEYKGLKATKRVVLVSDEDVEKTLQAWREASASLVPVEDRPSQEGDTVSVNLAGKYVEPKEEEDLKAEGVEVELGAEGLQPEFTTNLLGVKVDDVREFRVIYPEDFTSQGLAGKTIDFLATVAAVRQKELPELDDEFARQFGETETLEKLRVGVRLHLRQSRDRDAEVELRNDLLEQVLRDYGFEIPASLVKQRALERANEFANLLVRNGMDPQAVKNLDWNALLAPEVGRAIRDMRLMMIASKIAEAENIHVANDEIDAAIANLADASGEPFSQLKARLTKEESLSSIENKLVYEKALDVIVSNAEITVEEVTSEQEAERVKAKAASESQAAQQS